CVGGGDQRQGTTPRPVGRGTGGGCGPDLVRRLLPGRRGGSQNLLGTCGGGRVGPPTGRGTTHTLKGRFCPGQGAPRRGRSRFLGQSRVCALATGRILRCAVHVRGKIGVEGGARAPGQERTGTGLRPDRSG